MRVVTYGMIEIMLNYYFFGFLSLTFFQANLSVELMTGS